MNRIGFMGQLESLLSDIPAEEKEEALQYYNDYFDDAGQENEEEVIRSLGSPSKVAETIKSELRGEKARAQVKPGDHAVIRYGADKEPGAEEAGQTPGQNMEQNPRQDAEQNADRNAWQNPRQDTEQNADRNAWQNPRQDAGQNADQNAWRNPRQDTEQNADQNAWRNPRQDADPGAGQNAWKTSVRDAGRHENRNHAPGGLPGWCILLIVLGACCVVPVLIGLIAGVVGCLVGLIGAWIGVIVACGAACLGLFAAAVVLIAVAVLTTAASPLVFATMIGVAMLCGGFGFLMLMFTVFLVGKATPFLLRGMMLLLGWMFAGLKSLLRRGPVGRPKTE